jgi:hypothetical protein
MGIEFSPYSCRTLKSLAADWRGSPEASGLQILPSLSRSGSGEALSQPLLAQPWNACMLSQRRAAPAFLGQHCACRAQPCCPSFFFFFSYKSPWLHKLSRRLNTIGFKAGMATKGIIRCSCWHQAAQGVESLPAQLSTPGPMDPK